MKKIFLSLITILTFASVTAQLKVDLILSTTPPAALSEWASRREVLTAIVSGQPGLPPQQFKIKAEIKTTDGTVIGTTDLARAAVYTTSAAGTGTILYAADVVPLEVMIFTGKYRSSLQKTGKLPSDNYMLCVTLVRLPDYPPSSNQVCKNFYLATTQLPILMKPYNEQVLDAAAAQTAITFRWTPVVPRLTEPVTYRIQVVEVLPHQTTMQALRSNQPILDQSVTNATQYIWRPQLAFDTDGKDDDSSKNEKNINTSEAGLGAGKGGLAFIWTIQSLDVHGNPVTQTDGSGEARSEPLVFYIKMKAREKGNR